MEKNKIFRFRRDGSQSLGRRGRQKRKLRISGLY